jgi:hypothetical protein
MKFENMKNIEVYSSSNGGRGRCLDGWPPDPFFDNNNKWTIDEFTAGVFIFIIHYVK